MATEVFSTTFQLKRGLASAWERLNPILAAGEPGWTLDTHILKVGDGIKTWKELKPVNDYELSEDQIQQAINRYLEEHPITITTDATLTVAGQAADAAAVREKCVFNTDQIIFYAGDADDNTFV